MAFMKDFVLTKKNHFLKVRNLKQFQKKVQKRDSVSIIYS